MRSGCSDLSGKHWYQQDFFVRDFDGRRCLTIPHRNDDRQSRPDRTLQESEEESGCQQSTRIEARGRQHKHSTPKKSAKQWVSFYHYFSKVRPSLTQMRQ